MKKERPGVDCRLMYHSDLLEMEGDFRTYVIQVARNCGTNYRCIFGGRDCGAIFHREDEIVEHLRIAHETEILNYYRHLIEDSFCFATGTDAAYEKGMEVNFRTFVRLVARSYGTMCGACTAIFHTEDEMVQHLGRAELNGGHKTAMLTMYNDMEMELNFDTFLIRVARELVTCYGCVYCDEIFRTKYWTVEHLGRAELEGGHETEMRNSFFEEQALLSHIFF